MGSLVSLILPLLTMQDHESNITGTQVSRWLVESKLVLSILEISFSESGRIFEICGRIVGNSKFHRSYVLRLPNALERY